MESNAIHYMVIVKTSIIVATTVVIFLLFLKAELKHQLDGPSARNATFMSPRIQNELIEIISHDILQKDLVEVVREAKFF